MIRFVSCHILYVDCLSTRDFHDNRCLQTPLGDLKKIGVFTNKIIFHLHNLSTAPRRVFNNMTGDTNEASIVTLSELALYSAANDSRPQMIPRPEMIPDVDHK